MSDDALEVLIRAALTTATRTITPANGFFTALGDHILDGPKADDAIDSTWMPAGYWWPGVEAPGPGCTGGLYDSAWEFWFYGVVRAPLDQVDDVMSRMKADVKKAVLTDPSLGLGAGVVNGTDWGGAHRAVSVTDENGFGRIALRFVVSADWSPSAA